MVLVVAPDSFRVSPTARLPSTLDFDTFAADLSAIKTSSCLPKSTPSIAFFIDHSALVTPVT